MSRSALVTVGFSRYSERVPHALHELLSVSAMSPATKSRPTACNSRRLPKQTCGGRHCSCQ
eukprot:4478885-Amphidinium_carterae.1